MINNFCNYNIKITNYTVFWLIVINIRLLILALVWTQTISYFVAKVES